MKIKTKRFIPFVIVATVLLAIVIALPCVCANSLIRVYLTNIFCGMPNDFSGAGEALAASDSLVKNAMEESAILLINKDHALPLQENERKLNVFGSASADKYFLLKGVGSGSSTIQAEKEITLMDALDKTADKRAWSDDVRSSLEEERLFEVNTALRDFYAGTSVNRDTPGSGGYRLAEPSLTAVQNNITDEDKNNPAVVVFSRNGGENIGEIPQTGGANGGTYLQLTTDERTLLQYVTETFPKTIVLINSCNTMHLGDLEEFDVDAAFFIGLPGQSGTVALNRLFAGTGSPSGKATDIYTYSPSYDPTYVNNTPNSGHILYAEDIYYGYKWYETADADGYFADKNVAYEDVVQFPFGYGLSYTDFDWSDVKVTVDGVERNALNPIALTENSEVKIDVKVTNKGDYDGKDVVELFYTPPYTSGGIEKAHVNLLDFVKTSTIKAAKNLTGDESNTDVVSLSFTAYDLASYDCYDKNENGFKGYELEEGDYQVKLMTDSHNLKDMTANTITFSVASDIKMDKDPVTGETVENRFTGESAYLGVPLDGSTAYNNFDKDKTYMSRADFAGTYPTRIANSFNSSVVNVAANSLYNEPYEGLDMPTQGSGGTLSLTYKDDEGVDQINKEFFMQLSGNIKGYDYSVDDEEDIYEYVYLLDENGNVLTDENGDPIKATDSEGNYIIATDEDGNPIVLETVNKKYDEAKAKNPTWEEDRMAAYDDPIWDELLDQITVDELKKLVQCAGFRTEEIASIGKKKNVDYDGPAGFNTTVQGQDKGAWTAYPSETLLGSSWDKNLLLQMGLSMGAEASATGVSGWYAPGVNLHRSAYTARNYEYYSEDGVLSGKLAAQVIWGAKVNNLYCYIKHFCLSEPGPNPGGLNTWVTEQNFRENYLKPFELAVKEGKSNAVMTAFNRVGGTWAGANYAMNVEVLRNEWGFRGSVLTDWSGDSAGLGGMNVLQGIRAGNDIWLNNGATPNNTKNVNIDVTNAIDINCSRTAAHNVLWTYVDTWRTNFDHSKDYENGIGGGSILVDNRVEWWWVLIALFDLIIIGGATVWGLWVFGIFDSKKKKAVSGVEKTDAASVSEESNANPSETPDTTDTTDDSKKE